MKADIRVSLIQAPIVWENRSANLHKQEERLAGLAGHTDLAILPEMFTTANYNLRSVRMQFTMSFFSDA